MLEQKANIGRKKMMWTLKKVFNSVKITLNAKLDIFVLIMTDGIT